MHKFSCISKLFCVLASVMLILSLVGCQPTPDRPPVVNKADGGLEEKIKESSIQEENTPSNVPENVQRSFIAGKHTVNVNAELVLPEASQIPLVKVVPDKFKQEQVDRIIQTLMQGKPIYESSDIKTKAELEEELIMLKKLHSQKTTMESDTKEGTEENKKGELDKRVQKKLSNGIKQLEERIKTAPETVEKKGSDGKLRINDLGAQEITVVSELGKKKDAFLSIYVSPSGKICNVWFSNQSENISYYGKQSSPDKAPRGMNMTREEAEALAVKTVENMGCDLKLAAVRLGTAGGLDATDEDPPQAYIFWFTREVDGVPTTFEINDGSMVDVPAGEKAQYFEPYPYERLYVIVDDTGIVELQWTSPVKVTEKLSDHVQTLSIDEVMDIFEKQFFIRNALKDDDGEIKQSTYKVDRITLGLVRMPVKDMPDEYMLVPVWDFFGTQKVEFTDPNREPEERDFSAESFLTINAIDGSVLDRAGGGGLE